MKTGTIVLIGAAGLAAYYFGQLGIAANTVQILFDGVNIKGVLNYELQLMVQNVSNAAVTLNALSGNVTVNNNDLGNVSSFKPVTIPATSQQQVNITLNPSILSLPSTVTDLINNSGGNLDFVITGNANVNGLVLPFNLEKTITV